MKPMLLEPKLTLLCCLLGALACAGYLMRSVAKSHGWTLRGRRAAQFVEPAVLLLCLVVLLGWPYIGPFGSGDLQPPFSPVRAYDRLWLVYTVAVGFAN